jgi:hypothetical protein
MLAAWVLGTLFFAFIFGFILYALTIDVRQPEVTWLSGANAPGPRGDDLLTEGGGKHRVSRDYQIVFSPKVFVNYPFGLKVVFPMAEAPEPGTVCELDSVTEGPQMDVKRGFRESDYYSWPRVAKEDPQLIVRGGHIEFEAEEAEPAIRVELRPDGGAFQTMQASGEQTLKRDRDTVYSFWLNPLQAHEGLLTAVISLVTNTAIGGQGTTSVADNGKASLELAAIPLAVSVVHFPIRLR